MQQKQAGSFPQLSRTPAPLMLWGMGVGYVIPGMYFSWNLGLERGGTYGLAIAAATPGVIAQLFELKNLQLHAFAVGWQEVWTAIPFTIWFFLRIEGVTNIAEERINLQLSVVPGFGSAIITLIVLCLFTFISSTEIGGREEIIYTSPGTSMTTVLMLRKKEPQMLRLFRAPLHPVFPLLRCR
jgi:hypothetical protein